MAPGKIVEDLGAADPRIKLLKRPGKLGLGTATLAAMKYAMDHGYDYLQNMDADFSHPPRYLPGIIAGMSKYDVMIGSRYVKGGGTENWPLPRKIISRSVNTLVRFLFRMPVQDASGAYRCYRVSKLREVRLDLVQSRGYSFQQEVLFRCHKAKCKMGEFPIIFENRRAGTSKVNRQEALRSMGMILYLGFCGTSSSEWRKVGWAGPRRNAAGRPTRNSHVGLPRLKPRSGPPYNSPAEQHRTWAEDHLQVLNLHVRGVHAELFVQLQLHLLPVRVAHAQIHRAGSPIAFQHEAHGVEFPQASLVVAIR